MDVSLEEAWVKGFHSRKMCHIKLKCICLNILNISLLFCSLLHQQRDITTGWGCVQVCFMEGGCWPQGRQTTWQHRRPAKRPTRGQTKVVKGRSETFWMLLLKTCWCFVTTAFISMCLQIYRCCLKKDILLIIHCFTTLQVKHFSCKRETSFCW